MALFMEPNFEVKLDVPDGAKIENVFMKEDIEHKLSPLKERWVNGMTFG